MKSNATLQLDLNHLMTQFQKHRISKNTANNKTKSNQKKTGFFQFLFV